jgi:hypothetical protein
MNKQYIKDGKIERAPLTILDGDNYVITNDHETILSYGWEEYKEPEPTLEERINFEIEHMIERVNRSTDEKILNDFVWKDQEFYLTIENQTNFANLFIARDFMEFPQTIKTKTGYAQLTSKAEVEEFYLAGVSFVKQCLEEGWKEKTKREEKIRQRYAEQQTTSEQQNTSE